MEQNDQVSDTPNHTPPTQSQRRLSSYKFLLRMSKRLGGVATKSFVEVKQFLNQDVSFGPSEKFLAGLTRIRSQSVSVGTAEENAKSLADADRKNLESLISQSHEVLVQASTVFPITLFPDTVVVDRMKVTIIKRDFFWSSDTMTFRIEDVLNAEVTVGPLFGSLIIASRVMSTTDHFRIDHFWRNDAVYLKQIIQGYVIAQHNKIDVAHLSKDDLVKTLNELGRHRG